MWMRILAIAAVCIAFCGAPSTADASTGLRSAYLGTSVWDDNLDANQINAQLREHFAEVITRLEAKNDSSLLTALKRAEATSENGWTESQRRAALVYLASNRQQQITRLRSYASRGLFPVNEGQAIAAAPIFVDRRDTHCAVGYLMHVDGRDAEVANVVSSNNLVKVMDADMAGLTNWIRTSGLIREEAAMIQPGYPIDLDATFEELATTTPTVMGNGFTLSSVTIRSSRFNTTLPDSFRTDPSAINDILEQGRIELENSSSVVGSSTRGVLFGPVPDLDPEFSSIFFVTPQNLNDWLYIGPDDALLSAFVPLGQEESVGIVEVEYELRSNRGDFSQIVLTSLYNEINGEANAMLLLSEIYDDDTSELLGEVSLFATGVGPATNSSSSITELTDSDALSLTAESVRIKTFALLVAERNVQNSINSFFHEFETNAGSDLGDVNGDGAVDFLDIAPFIAILSSGGYLEEADIDGSGVLDFLDVAPFIGILSGQ